MENFVMLNELYLMHKGLEKIGESPEIKHNDIQSPGMGTTFRVLLDHDGNANQIELMSKDQIKDTWTLGNGFKNQFPAAKLVRPLFPDAHKSHKKWREENRNSDDKTYRLSIKKLIDDYSVDLSTLTCWPDYRNKILERKEQLKVMDSGDAECIYQLFYRYSKSANGLSILEQVTELLIKSIDNADRYTLKAIGEAFFGDSVDTKGNIDGNRVTLILDFLPKNEIDIFATSRQWVSYITEALSQSENNTEKNISTCALSGEITGVVKKTFPKEKLRIVGNTILFAKNAGTSGPTVKRYDKSGADAFSLSDELSQKLAASIAFLSSEKFKGKTWSKLSSSTGTSPSLLIAYCRDDLSLAITPLITGDSDIDDLDDYLDATETVLNLYNQSDCSPDAIVDIAEIIVLDKANRKVNFSSTSTLDKVSQAAKEWGAACTNTPDFKLLAEIGKTKKLLPPWPIAPQQLIYLSRQIYIRDGQASTSVPAISFSDTMKLFFSGNSNKQLANRCLKKLSDQYEPLIKHCALSKVQSVLANKAQVKTNPKNNTQALNTVTLMAVLLYKIERYKEVYMNDFAYQLGQLCSAIDELHIGYCVGMRGGQVPNSLIGNLTYSMALQNPTKALAALALRLKPYEAWVRNPKTMSPADNKPVDKAVVASFFAHKWLASQSENINKHFTANDVEVNDTYKAELMLGYLAGRPFEGKQSQPNSNDTQGDK